MARSTQQLQGATGRERYGYLEQNFDRTLLHLFAEVSFWEKLRFEIPYAATAHTVPALATARRTLCH